MLPANQRFGTDQRLIGQSDLRLIIGAQFAHGDGLAKLAFQHQPLKGSSVHLPVVKHPHVAPFPLGAVQRGVRVFEQFSRIGSVMGIQGDADGNRRPEAMTGDVVGLLKSFQ